ncbi:hypothetical protein AB0395_37940 [Streptosporangium sp. NPDC051023]|uniref:hypothetical protein n=1 Tax=Streptosporangium sp. NPDC051023 TaxID=3155410 RepID=UPI00344F5E11
MTMWQRIESWFHAASEHVTVDFVPDEGAVALAPYEGYLRLFVAEGFLADRRSWAADQYPALHGGVSLSFLGGEPLAFTTMGGQAAWLAPGVTLDEPITPLLPYGGGTVTVQAGLYRVSGRGPLGTAVQIVGGLAGLVAPPLAAAANVATKVSEGIDRILGDLGEQPVLGVHRTMVAPVPGAPGAGGRAMRAGHLVVIDSPRPPGTLSIEDGRLRVDGRPPTGADFLVLRIECRTERDDWRFPELAQLIDRAGEEYLRRGETQTFRDLRSDAVVRAWCSPDLTPLDRKRVARLIAGEIDEVRRLGAVPGQERSLEEAAALRLLPQDAPELADLRLADLLA